MGSEIINRITDKLSKRDITLDKGQARALKALSHMAQELKPVKRGFFRRKPEMGKGVYLYGDVGRGKTMLMDAVYYELDDNDLKKYRVHFHSFMRSVHEYLHRYRQEEGGEEAADQAIPKFAKGIVKKYDFLCFDEFHVMDVADAMILSRLFTALFQEGVSIVMTSNWMPDRLYEGGLQRDRILPFIALIKQQMEIVELDGALDYRKQILKGHQVYFHPLTPETDLEILRMTVALTEGKEQKARSLEVKGRNLKVEKTYGDVAVMSFAELCEQPLGAGDYLVLAEEFEVLVLVNVPELVNEKRNEAKRFMTLIDILYDKNILLIVSAEATPDKLYTGHDHAFEFDRTVSRLIEMQSQTYLDKVIG